MYIQRQIAAFLCEGQVTGIGDSPNKNLYRATDIPAKNILLIPSGQYSSGVFQVTSAGSYSLPTPLQYDGTSRLSMLIRVNNTAKIVYTGSQGTNTALIKGTSGTTKGDHKGIFMVQDVISAITISSPAALGTDVTVEYFMFQLPDVTVSSSWRKGSQIIGYVTT